MVLNKFVKMKITNRNISYYRNLGYNILDNEIDILPEHLPDSSSIQVLVKCTCCNLEKDIQWYSYKKTVKTGDYYCHNCKHIKTKKKLIEKYGVDNVMKIDSVKNTLKETIKERYGENITCTLQVKSIKEKAQKTIKDLYNVDNVFQNEEIKEKIKIKNLENLGVEYPMQNKDVMDKSKETLKKVWGVEHISQNEEIKERKKEHFVLQDEVNIEKARQGLINKFGTNHPFHDTNTKLKIKETISSSEYKEKIKKIFFDKYGVESPLSLINAIENRYKSFYTKIVDRYNKLLINNNLDFNVLEIIEQKIFKVKDNKRNDIFFIPIRIFYDRIRDNTELNINIQPIGSKNSSQERVIREFLETFNIEYISNDKKILNGKELDIFIPSKNIAIEFNGVYWHSEKFKSKNYHQIKSLECIEKGIQLIHIWEDDWIFKQNIIKSIILDKLNIHDNTIYARKTNIRKVSSNEAMKFLNDNHLQGGYGSNIKLGLYYNNELVSLMTFGYRYINSKKEYELLRFCNKINTKIVGGASKLFNYFISNYEWDTINSYSDLSISHGNLYKKLGFKYSHLSKPNYYWVVDDIRKHRFNYNKKKLIREGYDSNKSESEIMYEKGYYKIFGCGQMKWIFNPE